MAVDALLVPRTEDIATIGTVMLSVFEEFSHFNPSVNIFGPEDDAANGAPPSIYWMPLSEEWTAPVNRGAPDSPGSLFERWVPVSFMIFGGVSSSVTASEALYRACDVTDTYKSRLVNCIHRQISQKSYKFVSCTWTPAGRTGIGMPCELVIAVRLPLVREDNPTIDKVKLNPVPVIAHPEDE